MTIFVAFSWIQYDGRNVKIHRYKRTENVSTYKGVRVDVIMSEIRKFYVVDVSSFLVRILYSSLFTVNGSNDTIQLNNEKKTKNGIGTHTELLSL